MVRSEDIPESIARAERDLRTALDGVELDNDERRIDDGGCGAWNWSHICRLPVDEDGRHAGDHRCGGCGDVWNQGPDDYDENFTNDYDGQTCEDELGIGYRTPEPPEVRAAYARAMGRAVSELVDALEEDARKGNDR